MNKGYVIVGAERYYGYRYIVWCENNLWIDLDMGKGKIFKTEKSAEKKAIKLGIPHWYIEIMHTDKILSFIKGGGNG